MPCHSGRSTDWLSDFAECCRPPEAHHWLADESHKQATVHFVPASRGNMAQTIRITS